MFLGAIQIQEFLNMHTNNEITTNHNKSTPVSCSH